jgi:hypothetical protein
MNRYLEILEGPTQAAVLVAEIKRWLYRETDFTEDNPRFHETIIGVVGQLENDLNRKIVRQKWRWWVPEFGDREFSTGNVLDFMRLPLGMNSDIVVNYKDEDGASQVFSDTKYEVNSDVFGNRKIALLPDESWPDDLYDGPNPIWIDFYCGWPIGNAWVADATYALNAYAIPTAENINGMVYQATVGGVASGTEPTWPTLIGSTVVDNAVTWTNVGLTVPEELKTAIKTRAADLISNDTTILLYPNKHILEHAYNNIVRNWRLQW